MASNVDVNLVDLTISIECYITGNMMHLLIIVLRAAKTPTSTYTKERTDRQTNKHF